MVRILQETRKYPLPTCCFLFGGLQENFALVDQQSQSTGQSFCWNVHVLSHGQYFCHTLTPTLWSTRQHNVVCLYHVWWRVAEGWWRALSRLLPLPVFNWAVYFLIEIVNGFLCEFMRIKLLNLKYKIIYVCKLSRYFTKIKLF